MDNDSILQSASELQTAYENTNIHLASYAALFNAHAEENEIDVKDPAVTAQDLAIQTAFLRKLKFRYLEQNAKSKYVTAIVSDIDDATIVTAEDNKELEAICEEKKEKLRTAKAGLADARDQLRVGELEVERKYSKLKDAATRAAVLRQKIIDARLALTRIRHSHPEPRLTISAAEQRLSEQVDAMQTLSDRIEQRKKDVHDIKGKVKAGTQALETLRADRAEVEKAVKAAGVNEDDSRLMPIYEQHIVLLGLLRKSGFIMEEFQSVSDNEVRLRYLIGRRKITVELLYKPNTTQLGKASVLGMEDLEVDLSELVEERVLANDAPGLISAVHALARAAA